MVFHNNNSLFCEILLSLPLRERGLKSHVLFLISDDILSLPLRERGLKFTTAYKDDIERESLPLRERGLKLNQEGTFLVLFRRSLCGSVD